MNSDEDEYSYDEDFAFGLSSINEEPSDLKSASCSSIEDFAKISSVCGKKAAVESLDRHGNDSYEHKCDDSQDSYLFDDDLNFIGQLQDEQKTHRPNENYDLSPTTLNASVVSETVSPGEDLDEDVSAIISSTLGAAERDAANHCRPDTSSCNLDKQDCNDTNDSYSMDEEFQDEKSFIGEVQVHVAPTDDHSCKDEPNSSHADIIQNDKSNESYGSISTPCTDHPTEDSTAQKVDETEHDDLPSQTNATTTHFTMDQISAQKWHDDKELIGQTEECKEDPKTKTKENTRAGQLFCWEHRRQKPKKPAPLPRCATLTTKARSSLGKSQTEPIDPKKPKHKYSKKRLQELAKPRKHHIYGGNENTNSNQSAIPKKKRGHDRNFLDRIEMMEKERREKLEHAAAEADYNAKVDIDKMRCPNCGRIQSYTEMISESMTCKNDRCHKKKIVYQKTQRNTKDFLKRLERSTHRKSIKIDEIREERRSSLTSGCLEKSQQQKLLMKKVSKNGQDFMSRMEKDVSARQSKLSRHVELMDESLNKAHTFKPTVNIPGHLIRNRKGGLSSLAVPARRYVQTFEERLEEMERKTGKKTTRSKKRSPIESLWQQGRERKYDETKMKKKFQKSYM